MSPPTDKGWCGGLSGVPYDLRGDRDGLPVLGWRHAPDLKALEDETSRFVSDGGEHGIEEERRLAYVAFTRARSALMLTAPVWADASTPRLTSRFLTELLDHDQLDLVAAPFAELPEPDDARQGGQPPPGRTGLGAVAGRPPRRPPRRPQRGGGDGRWRG